MTKLTRSRSQRTQQDQYLFEPLEPRAMLAARALADYFPLSTGDSWNYSGTLNGHPMTAVSTASAGNTQPGVPTTRLTTVFQPSAGGTPTTNTRYFANPRTGLRLVSEDFAEPSLETIFDYAGSGARLVTSSFNDGDVIHVSRNFTGSDSNNIAFTGEFVGDLTITGAEIIDTSAGSFEAIRFTLVGSVNETGSTGWTGAGTISETRWIVRGLGTVRLDYAQSVSYSDRASTSLRYNMGLTGSSRLGDIASGQMTGKGVVIAFGDTSPGAADGTNFAGIDINGGTKTRLFKFRNTSSSAITLAPGSQGFITISGANADEFTVVRQPDQVIQPGQTTLYSVRFDPSTTGFRLASVSLATLNNTERPFTFDIRGTGIFIGAINVASASGAAITNGATTAQAGTGTRFGSLVADGSARVSRTFVISNSGIGNLVLLSTPRVLIGGVAATDFAVTADPANSVAPGGSTFFTVTFDPNSIGAQLATVSIVSNDRSNVVFTFAITGTGV